MRKTKLMLRIEEKHQEPLETLLPRLLNSQGLSRTAEQWGVSKATVGYWQLKAGIRKTVSYGANGHTASC